MNTKGYPSKPLTQRSLRGEQVSGIWYDEGADLYANSPYTRARQRAQHAFDMSAFGELVRSVENGLVMGREPEGRTLEDLAACLACVVAFCRTFSYPAWAAGRRLRIW